MSLDSAAADGHGDGVVADAEGCTWELCGVGARGCVALLMRGAVVRARLRDKVL